MSWGEGVTVGPWGDEFGASYAGSAAQLTGNDPADFALAALVNDPQAHPSTVFASTKTSDKPMSERYGALSSSSPFGAFLDKLYSVDPMFRLDDAAVAEAKTAGQPPPGTSFKRDILVIFVGLAVLLIGVWALANTGPGRVVVSTVKKAAEAG